MPRSTDEQYNGLLINMLMIVRPGAIAVLFSLNLAGLSGCGPAASDHAQNLQSYASLAAQSESQHIAQVTSVPRNDPFPWAASPAPLSEPPGPSQPPLAAQEEPAPMPENLVLPTWIAQALDAPEASVRLQALDTWAQQGAHAPLDPLVVALDDEDDDVRTKAMEIIEQNWAIEQEAEPEAE